MVAVLMKYDYDDVTSHFCDDTTTADLRDTPSKNHFLRQVARSANTRLNEDVSMMWRGRLCCSQNSKIDDHLWLLVR
jgi:hypothetical protein